MGGRLNGAVALVTGGAAGIGRGIAGAFAAEGASVAVLDRHAQKAEAAAAELAAGGRRAVALGADVSEPEAVDRAVSAAIREFGRIDVLVNNAGITTTAPLAEMPLEQWDETIGVDLTGVFLVTRAVLPPMIKRRSGRIINIASQLGLRGAPLMVHYCAAKAGVLGFTRALAREVATRGIRVNAIAPGPTETAILEGVPQETLDAIRAEIPLNRFATVDEIAPTAVMLASAEGDYYVGATLNVSGGHVM